MALADEVLTGDFLAIARAISLLEDGTPEGRRLLDSLSPRAGRALRIGLTGSPGVGKSTLLDELGLLYRGRGERVGIIAVDPTSPFTGGALLGDRIRMARVAETEDVFVRSMASRGAPGGLSAATQDVADLLDASGRTLILIETVGVGQSEIEISRAADLTVVMLSPESGDGIQAMKSGLLEIADVLVINKADRPGADRLESDLRTAFQLGPASRKEVRILLMEAIRGKGVPELISTVDSLVAGRRATGAFEARRRANLENRIRMIVGFLLQENLWETNGAGARVKAVMEDVAARQSSPYQAARRLIEGIVR